MAFSYNKMLVVIEAKKSNLLKNMKENKKPQNITIQRILEILDLARIRLTRPALFQMVNYIEHKVYNSESPGVESWFYPNR